jgi:hypothetical protein
MKMVRGLALILGAAAAALAFTAGPASAHGNGDGWEDDYYGNGGMHSSDNFGLLNGNQANFPIHIPLNVCGNSIAVLGLANSNASCSND